MKYLLDLFKIILFVAIMYLPLSWLSRKESINSLDQLAENASITKLNTVQNVTKSILAKNDMLEACQRLDAEISAGNIATYIIIGPESSCYKPDGMSELPPTTNDGVATSFVVKDIPLTFIKYTSPTYQWAVSVLTPQKINFIESFKNNAILRDEIIKDFLLVIYNVFAFILCAVLIFAESIKNKYKQNGKDPTWLKFLSKVFGFLQLNDIKIIKSATGALVKQNQDLNKDIDLLKTSLEYSILNEIKLNNHKIPYSFYGTVSKVDINGFSKVVAAGKSDTIQQMTLRLEDFGCELLQRYDGLFEKTIGDEIVVVFKGADSALRAAAFSRDLMQEFSNLNFLVGDENRQFTLKSAIYSSELVFCKRAAGYGFSGDALTFTTRLMDAVNIKDRNILSLTESQSKNLNPVLNLPKNTQKFEFKNMAPQNGHLVDEFTSLDLNKSDSHEKLNSKNEIPNENYFKSDHHISLFLENIKNQNRIDTCLSALHNTTVRIATTENINLWIDLIKNITQINLTSSQQAKLIMLADNHVPKHQWPLNATTALLAVPRNIDGRINASIIEVLMIKDISALQEVDSRSFNIENDLSGRTRGNILVFKAIQNLENKIFIDLITMIKSSDTNISKSGIYASCQIIQHYRLQNPAELETCTEFHKTLELLKKIRKSEKIKLTDRLKQKLSTI